MHITVHIYASLRCHVQAAEQLSLQKEWDVPQNAAVSQILDRLKLPKDIHVTVLINNRSVASKATLEEGDIVHVLPQMGGG